MGFAKFAIFNGVCVKMTIIKNKTIMVHWRRQDLVRFLKNIVNSSSLNLLRKMSRKIFNTFSESGFRIFFFKLTNTLLVTNSKLGTTVFASWWISRWGVHVKGHVLTSLTPFSINVIVKQILFINPALIKCESNPVKSIKDFTWRGSFYFVTRLSTNVIAKHLIF